MAGPLVMGCTVSDPLPDLGDVGYVCILMEEGNRCRLVHAPQNVTDAIVNLVRSDTNCQTLELGLLFLDQKEVVYLGQNFFYWCKMQPNGTT